MQKLSLGLICKKGTELTFGIGTDVNSSKGKSKNEVEDTATLKIIKKPKAANVRMINPDEPPAGNMGFLYPFFTQLMANQKPPSFSVKGEDWPKFKADFAKYLNLMGLFTGGKPLPNELKMELLKQCLDSHSKTVF